MTERPKAPIKAYLALGLGIAILGFSAILVRLANAPGPVVGFYRMAFGALLLGIPFLRHLSKGAALTPRGLGLAALAGVFFGGDLATWTSGIMLSGATLPTLFANTNPLWVGLGAWLLFKEGLKANFWVGVGIAFVGAVIILGPDLRGGLAPDPGILLGLLAGLFYGAYFLAAQRGRDQLDALSFFWIGTLSSALTLLIVNLLMQFPLTGYPAATWLNFLTQALLIQAAGWFLISYAQGYLPASLVSPTLLGQPVLTAILAGPLLGERLSVNILLGGAAVLLGILIVHLGRRPKKTRIPPLP